MRKSGWKLSAETKAKIAVAKVGSANPMWRGDNVGYHALHVWARKQVKKPKRCKDCKKTKSLELANISGEYHRDVIDWEWLCRRCHMVKDGRIKVLIAGAGRAANIRHHKIAVNRSPKKLLVLH